MGLEALLRGWVSRNLPQSESDNDPGVIRLGRYQDVYMLPSVRKSHVLADEGSYFVANNAGAGVASAAAPTSFSDTAPLLTIFNLDSGTNSNSKRIHLDFLRVVETAAGTAGTGFAIQIKLDNATRYASGGTTLSPTNPNMDVSKSGSVADIRLLPVGTAASTVARTVVGTAIGLHAMTAPVPVNSQVVYNFGGVEGVVVANSATVGLSSCPLPPVVIGPGQCALINFLIPLQSAASSWTAELGWWER